MASTMASTSEDQNREAYEEKNVHEVYQQIAKHFSATRYKPWPIVERFLQDQSPGAVGLDVGCGNGKYLPVNKDVYIVASDRYVPKFCSCFICFYSFGYLVEVVSIYMP
ncbi:hypothetical protein BDV18DRAFT_149213 [Aspergillus unguis]